MIDNKQLNRAGLIAERLRGYSEDKHGEPLIEEAADIIDELVRAAQEASDDKCIMIGEVRRLVEKWRRAL